MPTTKKTHRQIGILFVDNTHLWQRLDKENGVISKLAKGQQSLNSWDRNLLVVGGEVRPDKCSYIVHRIKPTTDGNREYVQEKTTKMVNTASVTEEELEDLLVGMDDGDLDNMDPAITPFTTPLTK